ncbi:MAG: N-acetylmuramoyl-L-alanine amidase [Chloroflexi bacterium]|nr:N-acetylmuramoyl-L-alanine amidase [Chloroflexota bacterium]
MNSVSATDAFAGGKGNLALLPGFDLELWGVPTSAPAVDPNNLNFVYQRFQRGVMHYDKTTGTTQGLLLADYFKAIIIGNGLPPDLNAQAKSSPLYKQYDSSKSGWIARPNDLPNSDLTGAFEPEATVVIDPGHGGLEIGAVGRFPDGTVLREKDVNLQVANRVAELLKKAGYRVIQTRTADTSVSSVNKGLAGAGKLDIAADLQARMDIANNARATLFLAIHFNGHSDPDQRGTEMFYGRGRPHSGQSLRFATLMQQKTVAALSAVGYATVNRGVKDDQRAVGTGNYLYLLGPNAERPTTMPGALAEGLFLTNAADLAQLRDPKVIEAIARAYAAAVSEYLGPSPTSATSSSTIETYMVAAGDTLSAIAARFNVSVLAIVQTNDITDPSMIIVGQKLTIPAS